MIISGFRRTQRISRQVRTSHYSVKELPSRRFKNPREVRFCLFMVAPPSWTGRTTGTNLVHSSFFPSLCCQTSSVAPPCDGDSEYILPRRKCQYRARVFLNFFLIFFRLFFNAAGAEKQRRRPPEDERLYATQQIRNYCPEDSAVSSEDDARASLLCLISAFSFFTSSIMRTTSAPSVSTFALGSSMSFSAIILPSSS